MVILIFFKKYSFKIKKYYILLLCILIFINYYQTIIKEKYSISKENIIINKYSNLKNLNDSLFVIKEKKSILNLFSKDAGRNISSVDTIFFATNCNFGNCIAILNKILFYCEIIGCKTIILDENIYWYVKKRIFYGKNNISIEVGEKKKLENISSLYYNSPSIYYTFFDIKPEIRIDLIRNEIIQNLNKVNVDKEDLYIHIRSGDIFVFAHSPYAQPPFCFYKTILNNYKFNKVYLIAQDTKNPVIEKILSEYNNVIYKHNDLILMFFYILISFIIFLIYG